MHYYNGTVAKMLKDYPAKTHIAFIFVSGRGLVKDGRTCLLLNEFGNGHYVLAEVEFYISK